MNTPFSLKNKTILITGASSGIGRATAVECSKMGARLIITGRNKERLNETLFLLEGTQHSTIIADLTTNEGIDEVIMQSDNIDGVVFSAGVAMVLPFQNCNIERIRNLMEVNFFSPAELARQLVKKKKLSSSAVSFVFISSIAGTQISIPGSSVYGASKAAITGLIKGMALELAAKKIRVNAISPGMIETEMTDETKELVSEEAIEIDKKRYPLGHRYGTPQEVAYAAIYLLSDASSFTTGSNLLIDGGYTLQ